MDSFEAVGAFSEALGVLGLFSERALGNYLSTGVPGLVTSSAI